MFRILSIWEERNYIKLYSAIQLWKLHKMSDQPVRGFAKYSKEDFVANKEAKKTAKEFFQVAYNTAAFGTHSVHEGRMILLYDYLSAFEDSDERIFKATGFLESLNLGRIGSNAKEEFFSELEGHLPNTQDEGIDNELEEEQLANLNMRD